jgi:hypothetical protein
MSGLEVLAAGWGYAEGDPRWVGAIVIAVAVAAGAFLVRRALASRPGRGRDPR